MKDVDRRTVLHLFAAAGVTLGTGRSACAHGYRLDARTSLPSLGTALLRAGRSGRPVLVLGLPGRDERLGRAALWDAALELGGDALLADLALCELTLASAERLERRFRRVPGLVPGALATLVERDGTLRPVVEAASAAELVESVRGCIVPSADVLSRRADANLAALTAFEESRVRRSLARGRDLDVVARLAPAVLRLAAVEERIGREDAERALAATLRPLFSPPPVERRCGEGGAPPCGSAHVPARAGTFLDLVRRSAP